MSQIAAIVLTLNEEPRIKDCLKHLRPFVDHILVVDGRSNDKTREIATKYADAVRIRPKTKNFAEEKNWAEDKLPLGCEWVLYCDADERFSQEFLRNMRFIVSKTQEDAIRFPRINQPDRKDYPDYQVRLLRRGRAEWRHSIHEIPYSPVEGKPMDQVSCRTIDFPIIHLARRTDEKRGWW